MPLSLVQLAEKAQDQYYQDYAPRDKFFDIGDFKFHAAAYYSSALDAMYQAARRENKAQDGFSNMEISAAWLIKDTLPVVKSENGDIYAKPHYDVFSFNFDAFANGLNGVRATGKNCNGTKFELIKISNNDPRFLSLMPQTGLVFYYMGPENRIIFTRDVKEVEVWYIPRVMDNDDTCVLSDNIASDVITKVLTLMFGAKSGNLIQESNDGNKNLAAQTQGNPLLNKNIQPQ
jgi:hypothetical protein